MAREWFDEDGILIIAIPQACVHGCSHSGQCQDNVAHWVKELGFNVPRDIAVEYLAEFGAWEDLEEVSDDELAERVLWIACGDIEEEGSWYGLVH